MVANIQKKEQKHPVRDKFFLQRHRNSSNYTKNNYVTRMVSSLSSTEFILNH